MSREYTRTAQATGIRMALLPALLRADQGNRLTPPHTVRRRLIEQTQLRAQVDP
jgi:hypothetical protein